MSTLFPHPVLHRHTMDYRDSDAYEVTFARNRQPGKAAAVVTVEHRLKKNTLLATLVERGDAAFYCTVAVDRTAYRLTEEATEVSTQDYAIVARQEIAIPAFRNYPDIFTVAGIHGLGEQQVSMADAVDLDDFYKSDASTLELPKHGMLATSGWRQLTCEGALFRTVVDDRIKKGGFKAETCYQPLRITVRMNRELFDEMEKRNEVVRAQVLCASLSIMLKELHEKYKNCEDGKEDSHDDASDLEVAGRLKKYLRANGIPTWEDDDFNPTEAASMYKPALLDDTLEDD